MSKILIILLLFTSFSYSQEFKYHGPFTDLENGESYYLFGDNVRFRELPDTNSQVIELLKIGTEIQLVEKSTKTVNYNGIESPFYKVKYKGQTGYILGGLISLEKIHLNNSTYLFAQNKTSEYQYAIQIRELKDDLSYTESTHNLNTASFSIDILGKKGIENIENILFINYMSEACGVDGGGIYFFKLKNELKKVFEIAQVSDAGVFWYIEDLIFPTDEDGVNGKIIYQKEEGEYIDEETNWVEIKKVTRELEWKNGEILPKIQVPRAKEYE